MSSSTGSTAQIAALSWEGHGDSFVLCIIEQYTSAVVWTCLDGIPENRLSVFVYGVEDMDSVLEDE